MMETEVQRDVNNQPPLEIDVNEQTEYGILAKVLAEAKNAQMQKIGFVTHSTIHRFPRTCSAPPRLTFDRSPPGRRFFWFLFQCAIHVNRPNGLYAGDRKSAVWGQGVSDRVT